LRTKEKLKKEKKEKGNRRGPKKEGIFDGSSCGRKLHRHEGI